MASVSTCPRGPRAGSSSPGVDEATLHSRFSPWHHRSSLCIHSCLPFSIYSLAGAQCEWLAISLAAFLGILLGALALLCLLFAIACLVLHLCRQHRRQHQG